MTADWGPHSRVASYELDSVDYSRSVGQLVEPLGPRRRRGFEKGWRRSLSYTGSSGPPEGRRPEGSRLVALIHHRPCRSAYRARGAKSVEEVYGGAYGMEVTCVFLTGWVRFLRSLAAMRSSVAA